jgi:DNA-binding transcriptional regulator YiaG
MIFLLVDNSAIVMHGACRAVNKILHPAKKILTWPIASCNERRMDTAATISKKRHSLGLTQAEFAELIGVDTSTIWRWENGRVAPQVAVLRYIESLEVPR